MFPLEKNSKRDLNHPWINFTKIQHVILVLWSLIPRCLDVVLYSKSKFSNVVFGRCDDQGACKIRIDESRFYNETFWYLYDVNGFVASHIVLLSMSSDFLSVIFIDFLFILFYSFSLNDSYTICLCNFKIWKKKISGCITIWFVFFYRLLHLWNQVFFSCHMFQFIYWI